MTEQTIAVPCGRCPACYARRVSAWSFRLMQEEKICESSYFITLTYDTKFLCFSKTGTASLCKRDVQLFFKRLRKDSRSIGKKIRYFAVGEYGERSGRPHYHIIIFNADVAAIQGAWDRGGVYYGTVTGASVGYTLKYMSKKGKHPYGTQKPFALMSKGLGVSYITPAMVKWHNSGRRMYCVLPGNKKVSMPRYYKEKVFSPEMRKAVGVLTRQDMLDEASRKPVINSDDLAKSHIAAFARMELRQTQNQKL